MRRFLLIANSAAAFEVAAILFINRRFIFYTWQTIDWFVVGSTAAAGVLAILNLAYIQRAR